MIFLVCDQPVRVDQREEEGQEGEKVQELRHPHYQFHQVLHNIYALYVRYTLILYVDFNAFLIEQIAQGGYFSHRHFGYDTTPMPGFIVLKSSRELNANILAWCSLPNTNILCVQELVTLFI